MTCGLFKWACHEPQMCVVYQRTFPKYYILAKIPVHIWIDHWSNKNILSHHMLSVKHFELATSLIHS